MSQTLGTRLPFSLIVAAGLWCSIGRADSRTPMPEAIPFESIIARIREAEATKAWRKPEWKDETIEAGLKRLVASVKGATGKDFLKLPVEFKDVSADRDERLARINRYANGRIGWSVS